MDAKTILLAALVALTLSYLIGWFAMARKKLAAGAHGSDEPVMPRPIHLAIGAITNFFDTLGIGSFATTTASYKFWKLVPDEQIPGTLNVGHTINAVVQALVFIAVVNVEFRTLFLMIAAACAGAWLGAGVVSGLSRRMVQVGMGTALLGASVVVLAQLLDLAPGGTALALSGTKLAIGVGGNFVLGALMTLGVGLYAPCMVLISVLGMDPTAAFPIMMGSCAFLMPSAGVKFMKEKSYSLKPALGLTLGGIPAVLVGALIVKSLPLTTLRWLVVVVVLYSAVMMLRSGIIEPKQVRPSSPPPQPT
jgi:uncharacterized membrane protein YfcA